jgi:hypothetical protein
MAGRPRTDAAYADTAETGNVDWVFGGKTGYRGRREWAVVFTTRGREESNPAAMAGAMGGATRAAGLPRLRWGLKRDIVVFDTRVGCRAVVICWGIR